MQLQLEGSLAHDKEKLEITQKAATIPTNPRITQLQCILYLSNLVAIY